MKRIIILLALTLAACATAPPPAQQTQLMPEGTLSHANVTASVRSVCDASNGSRDPDHPFICVDPYATPQVKIKSLRANDRVNGSGNPVMIQWFTRNPSSELKVTVPVNSPCFDGEAVCFPGGGRCRVFTKRVTTEQTCEYDIWVNGNRVDPIIIVQPCCALMDLAPVAASQMQ